ncbi:MAG TPA: NAD(P)/FAD-dependent oxidoreductase, partial [Thermoanaerobaculia bacterium]|nr:NAD(P)/FAD-dependent oxidoreductase [Thermoanaerobaculia bacterium]
CTLPGQPKEFTDAIERVTRPIESLRRDVSFAEFLRTRRNLSPRMRELARTYVEGFHAAHADRISTLALSGGTIEKQFRILDGYDSVIAWLRAGIDPSRAEVRFSTVVKSIEWSDGDVTIATSKETFHARAAVLTIPIGVWKAPQEQEGAIRFDPPLREKESALEHLEAAHVVRIVFRFREPFWEPSTHFVHNPSDRFMPTWWTTNPIRTALLTGWAGGHAADAMLAEGSDAMIDRALDAMSRAFAVPRRKIASRLIATWTHDWQSDPFSRCAYSYPAVGGSNAHAALAKPIRRTLFFAGEATSAKQFGTVAGAIESGRRAAREMLRMFTTQ